MTTASTKADILTALARACPDGMHSKFYSIDDIRKLVPEADEDTLEDAILDAEADGLVSSLPVLSGPLRIRLTDNFYEVIDPVAMGWVPHEDAVIVARAMLADEEQAASKIQSAVGMDRRRFNPAFRHVLAYLEQNGVGGLISREIQPHYAAAAVVFTPKVKAVLRKLVADAERDLTPPRPQQIYETPGVLPIAIIAQRISQRPAEVEFLASKLAALIDRELEKLDETKPNDPESLTAHEEYRSFLREVSDGLKDIATAMGAARKESNPTAKRTLFKKTSEILEHLGEKVDEWIKKNSGLAVDYSSKTALLGLGTLFLTACGAPAYMAFPVLTFLLGGKQLHDAVKGAKDKKKAPKNDE